MAVVTQRRPNLPPGVMDGGRDGCSNGGGWDDSGDRPVPSAQLGLALFLIAVTMLFAGFASAYIISRRGKDWQDIPIPQVLWLSTTLLLLSSGALEKARRALKRAQTAV